MKELLTNIKHYPGFGKYELLNISTDKFNVGVGTSANTDAWCSTMAILHIGQLK